MKIEQFVESIGADFFVGVPDSQLKALCNYLMKEYGIDRKHHIIAANEGNAVAIAAGYYLATGKIPVVYMQNSGIGNALNPVMSLLNDKVYAVPVVFVIGWRGEPGVHDEPQHIYQGEMTVKLIEDMDISTQVVRSGTDEREISKKMEEFRGVLSEGKSVAFVISKGALQYNRDILYKNGGILRREEVIEHITKVTEEDLIVSTTGKASRELFEIRERQGKQHQCDFLTVGSMGHSSSISLGIALNNSKRKVWCIDGDGAALMHMGAMAIIGANKPENMVHIVINNCAHETVGGMPTVAGEISLINVAKACGYPYAVEVECFEDLDRELAYAKAQEGLKLIEVKCAIGARKDLGRPTVGTVENKKAFMKEIRDKLFENLENR